MEKQSSEFLAAIKAMHSLLESFGDWLSAHFNFVKYSNQKIQRRITAALVCSAIAAITGVISLLLQLLQLLTA